MGFSTTQLRTGQADDGANSGGSAPETRRLAAVRAIRYLSDTWIPVNPEIHRRIRKNLKENVYRAVGGLLEDLQRDIALFSFCARQFSEGATMLVGSSGNISDRMRAASLEDYARLLSVSESRISTHQLEGVTELQAQRLQQAIVGVNATTLFAKRSSADPIEAYLIALVRQLGLMLVAWNYPRIYEKALATPKSDMNEVDRALHQILGYSVLEVGSEIASLWGLPSQAEKMILSLSKSQSPDPTMSRSHQKLFEACRMGEAVALLQSPDHFPTVAGRAKELELSVVELLGHDGMSLLHDHVNSTWIHYSTLLPEFFAEQYTYERSQPGEMADFARQSLSANHFVRGCSQPIQRSFSEVYRFVTQGKASAASLRALVGQLIPAAGFSGGCIYLVETDQMKMIPKIMIGPYTKENFVPAFQHSMGVFSDPLSKAFMSSTPVRGQAIRDDEEVVLFFAARISGEGGKGVLYLETSDEQHKSSGFDVLTLFKAIHQCLIDSLNLKSKESGPTDDGKGRAALTVRDDRG